MRTFNLSIYLVKAAERDVIRRTARSLLRGLAFTTVYTPHFAMCTDTLSEILLETGHEEYETKSAMRFSCSGIYPRSEIRAIRRRMDELAGPGPNTVGLWQAGVPDYFDRAAAKASLALKRTLRELSRKPGDSFQIMIINNDLLPLFELLVPKEYNELEIAAPGDVIQFRYEVAICARRIISWQLVHAYHYR